VSSSRKGVQCDHIVPRVQGGGHGLGNLRDTCSDHHRAKTAQEGGGWRAGKRRRPDPPVQERTRWLPGVTCGAASMSEMSIRVPLARAFPLQATLPQPNR
jgi:hypothetical protein